VNHQPIVSKEAEGHKEAEGCSGPELREAVKSWGQPT